MQHKLKNIKYKLSWSVTIAARWSGRQHNNDPVECLRVQHSGRPDRHLETLRSPETQSTASVWPHILSPQSEAEHVAGITLPACRTLSEQEVNMRQYEVMIPSEGSLHLHSPTLSYVVEDLDLFDAIRCHGNKVDDKMTLY